MKRAFVVIHRWLGVAFCLLFAMWFASGIVMHFMPFPALTEAERVAGLAPFDPNLLRADPRAAIAASGLSRAVRVRAFARNDGPIYIVLGASGLRAFKGPELASAGVVAAHDALAIAAGHAQRRGIASDAAAFAELADYDQWTVSNRLDPHRPLYRIALNDEAATELYVSSTTGEVVRDTNARERGWNYVGSVAHWIYPTALRRNLDAWLITVWWLALAALIAAITGTIVGLWGVRIAAGRVRSPYSGWQAWHHWLGLGCTVFILSWTFSGWLSMDNGLLFSNGKLSPEEAAIFSDKLAWQTSALPEPSCAPRQVLEVEWFAFGERVYRRDRLSLDAQRLRATDETQSAIQSFLEPADAAGLGTKFGRSCHPPVAVKTTDDYPLRSVMAGAPVYRLVCGDVWFNIDGASGAPLERLDGSRRANRWLYQGLHTLDFAALNARPFLRTALISGLCGLGMLFSVTAIVIALRRLRHPTL